MSQIKCENEFTVGKLKRCVIIFSNDHSLRGFDLSYLNSMKLVYQTWQVLISAHVLENWASIWKNEQCFWSKTGQRGYEFSYQKGPKQMPNFLHEEKVGAKPACFCTFRYFKGLCGTLGIFLGTFWYFVYFGGNIGYF